MISINTKIKADKTDDYQEAICKIKELSTNGITKIIITKAIDENHENLNIEETKELVNTLNEICDKNRIFTDIYPGSLIEASYTGVDEYIKGLAGTLNDSSYVLIDIGEELDNEVLEIINEFVIRGKTPVIAAPETNLAIQRDPKRVKELVKMGCLFQLNIKGLNGNLGKKPKKVAKYLLKKDLYDFLEVETITQLKKLSKNQRECCRDNSTRLLKDRYIATHKWQYFLKGIFKTSRKETKEEKISSL